MGSIAVSQNVYRGDRRKMSLTKSESRRGGVSHGRPSDGHPLRVVLYSHDTVGLGHFRRNLLIAKSLVGSPLKANVLLVAGAVETRLFPLPQGVDCVTLPSLSKLENGDYGARSLGLSLAETLDIRGDIIRAAVKAFEPDVFIVDKVPRGVAGELLPVLEWARENGHVRCILGLRDILDDPETARREWDLADNDSAVRDYYDDVWIYGDPYVYDLVSECGMSEVVGAKAKYTGYLDCHNYEDSDPAALSLESLIGAELPGRVALCLVGGGEDGGALAHTFADTPLPPDMTGVILPGPFMPEAIRKRLHEKAENDPKLYVIDFVARIGEIVRRADRVVTMGGYNTLCELLSLGKRTLVVPRVMPRREQLVRGERMRDLGLVDLYHPDELTTQALHAWLCSDVSGPSGALDRIRMNGLLAIQNLLRGSPRLLRRRALGAATA